MRFYFTIFISLFSCHISLSQIQSKLIDSSLPETIIYIYRNQSKGLTESFYYCPKADSSVQYFYESTRFARKELLVMEKSSRGFKVKFADSPTEYLFKADEIIKPDNRNENIPARFIRLNPDGSKSNFELYRYFKNYYFVHENSPKVAQGNAFSVIYINEKSPIVESITLTKSSVFDDFYYYQSKTLKEQELEELRQVNGIIYLKFKDKPTIYPFLKGKANVYQAGFAFYDQLIRLNPDGSKSVFTLQD